jgi:pimeloyl-ACP methyl ester carboxylesterase
VATYVLVHRGWDAGWAWRSDARELQAAGHEVFTPTLTGSGERAHLASPKVDLDTHILDVANALRYEDLRDVILVGLSNGGMTITGVAEQVAGRIAQLIYMDAFVPRDGECLADMLHREGLARFQRLALTDGDGWRVLHARGADRRTDALLKAGKQPLAVGSPDAARLVHTFVQHTAKPADSWLTPLSERMAARARRRGGNTCDRPFGHFSPLVEKPREVAELLLELTRETGHNMSSIGRA